MQARNRTWLLGSDPVERCRQRTMAIEGGDGSTLSLDFTSGVLDPRLTFSRASTATFVNSSGYVEYAGANLLLQSETISTSPWIDQNGASRLQVSVTNPIGGTTCTQVTSAGASNAISQGPTYQTGMPHVIRIWVRAGTSSQLQLGVYAGAGFVTGSISVVSGTATISGTGLFLATGLTSTWTQLQIVYTSLTGSGAFLIYPDTASPVAARTIYVWGAQLNPGSTAQTYYPTTTAAYHAPRFDNALLTSRTNLVLQSNNFSTSPWVQKYGTAATLTPDYTVAGVPDGFSGTATRLQSSVAASGITQPLSLSVVSGKALKLSLFIKSNTTANQLVSLEYETGGGNVVTATPVWQRRSFTSLVSITKFALEGLGAGLDISICGAQVEYVNTVDPATAYIPTTTTQVSANTTQPRGLLIEQSLQNFITQSQALSGYSPYSMMAISIDGTVPDPMGGTETKKVAAATSATSVFHGFLRNGTNAGTATTVTVSIFAKKNNYKYLYLYDGSTNTASTRFNLETGVADQPAFSAGYVSSKMTSYPNGWWRCEMTANVPANLARSWGFQPVADTATYAGTGASYVGTGNIDDGIYVIGWQVEAGMGASSYIPTGSSTVTRNADLLAVTSTAIMGLNTSEGTFFVEAELPRSGINSPAIFGAPYANGSWLGQLWGAGDATTLYASWWGAQAFGLARSGNPKSLSALSYGLYTGTSIPVSSSLNGAVAGGTFTTSVGLDAPNPATWSYISLACNAINLTGSGRDHLNSCIKKFKYFPTRLSNAQLQTLTTP